MNQHNLEKFGLYVILTNPRAGYEKTAEAAVAEKIRYLQLRMKHEEKEVIHRTALQIAAITRGSSTRFIVNDYVEIAMSVDADGVHLGQEDMAIESARLLWNRPDKIIGLSTHNEIQASGAISQRPDYIGVGPVFATPTKDIPDPVVGLKKMETIIQASPLTTVAIGGIDEGNLPSVLAHGAVNFCAVRAIMQSRDPQSVMHRMMRLWKETTR